jgi:hypothetical protein
MQAVLFSSYFPNIRYLSKFFSYDKIIIDIHENYPKQTWRNRCDIVTANSLTSLSVPVQKNNKIKTKDIKIDGSANWQKTHYRTIMSAYKNSAFYEHYIESFDFVFNSKETFLLDLNTKILDQVLMHLNLKSNYCFSADFVLENNALDIFRESIHPKPSKNKDDSKFIPIEYSQVFTERHGFVPNLSILDLIFNEGPLSASIIKKSIRI